MILFLGSLFCSIGLCVSFCARTILFWLLWLCNIVWRHDVWCLQLCSSFSRSMAIWDLLWFYADILDSWIVANSLYPYRLLWVPYVSPEARSEMWVLKLDQKGPFISTLLAANTYSGALSHHVRSLTTLKSLYSMVASHVDRTQASPCWHF